MFSKLVKYCFLAFVKHSRVLLHTCVLLISGVSRLLHITTKHFIFNIYHGGQSICNCGCKCVILGIRCHCGISPGIPECAVNECGISLTINMVSTTWPRPVLHS